MTVIDFPNASHRRRALRQTRVRKNMQTFLFRSYDLIVESDEADLVRDVCLDLYRAQTKLKRIQRRLKAVQEQAAAQVQLLTAADTKLTAAIVAALLSTRGGNANA
jgi:transposase